MSSLRCGPRQPPPPPLTALPLQQPDTQTAANRSKRPVAAFFGLGGTSGRGGARKRAVGPFPGFLAVSADSTLNGHLFQYFVDSSPLHLDTWLLRLPATTCRWLLHLDCSRSTELNGRYPATKSTAEISVPGFRGQRESPLLAGSRNCHLRTARRKPAVRHRSTPPIQM